MHFQILLVRAVITFQKRLLDGRTPVRSSQQITRESCNGYAVSNSDGSGIDETGMVGSERENENELWLNLNKTNTSVWQAVYLKQAVRRGLSAD